MEKLVKDKLNRLLARLTESELQDYQQEYTEVPYGDTFALAFYEYSVKDYNLAEETARQEIIEMFEDDREVFIDDYINEDVEEKLVEKIVYNL